MSQRLLRQAGYLKRFTLLPRQPGASRQRPLSCSASIVLCDNYSSSPIRPRLPLRASSLTCTIGNQNQLLVCTSVRCFASDKGQPKKDKKKPSKEAEEDPAAVTTAEVETTPPEAAASVPAAKKPKQDGDDDDDECPPWQNPLHHNNPDMMKQFPEDFSPGEEIKFNEAPPLEDPDNPDKILASQELYDLADEIVNLSMLEMKELVNKIGDHFGFEKPPFTGNAGAGGADEEEEAAEEVAAPAKTSFDLKLTGFDAASKIKVIKEVRAIANLGLKEAKDLVEGAPKTLMKDISKEIAEELAKKLEEVGATVEIV